MGTVNSVKQAQVIPIDGKTPKVPTTENRGNRLHPSAWASEHRLALGQVKVADKSNEITAIPALLELLDLAGCIITIDAMGTQTAIATQIYNAKGLRSRTQSKPSHTLWS